MMVLRTARLFLCGSERGTCRLLLFWEPCKICKECSGDGISFSMWGRRKGNPEGDFFSGDFERYVKRALEMDRLFLCRGSVRGSWREASFLGNLKRV
jgi:hypothetical protein